MGRIMHEVSKIIDELRISRNWTTYKLIQESFLSDKTVYTWFKTDTCPTIDALKAVCDAFGITLSEFFAKNETNDLNLELKMLQTDWQKLDVKEKSIVKVLISSIAKNK